MVSYTTHTVVDRRFTHIIFPVLYMIITTLFYAVIMCVRVRWKEVFEIYHVLHQYNRKT